MNIYKDFKKDPAAVAEQLLRILKPVLKLSGYEGHFKRATGVELKSETEDAEAGIINTSSNSINNKGSSNTNTASDIGNGAASNGLSAK
jgi:hypothetical protein